jgi:hypothetical protein
MTLICDFRFFLINAVQLRKIRAISNEQLRAIGINLNIFLFSIRPIYCYMFKVDLCYQVCEITIKYSSPLKIKGQCFRDVDVALPIHECITIQSAQVV